MGILTAQVLQGIIIISVKLQENRYISRLISTGINYNFGEITEKSVY